MARIPPERNAEFELRTMNTYSGGAICPTRSGKHNTNAPRGSTAGSDQDRVYSLRLAAQSAESCPRTATGKKKSQPLCLYRCGKAVPSRTRGHGEDNKKKNVERDRTLRCTLQGISDYTGARVREKQLSLQLIINCS